MKKPYAPSSTRKLKAQPLVGGERFGRLVAVQFVSFDGGGGRLWRFHCDCGQDVTTRASSVIRQGVQSCGCLRLDRVSRSSRKHGGHADHPAEARVWSNMLHRCTKPANRAFARYGGRGISVCERWHAFENFLADMGPRPSSRHSIDRRDNDGAYEPSNCRWATKVEQSRNRSGNRLVVFEGREMTVTEASELAGISRELAKQRLDRGEPVERAFRPARTYRRRLG